MPNPNSCYKSLRTQPLGSLTPLESVAILFIMYVQAIYSQTGALLGLYRMRHDRQLRQKDVAEMADVNVETISRAENGRSISTLNLAKIAKALDVEPGVLLRRPKDGGRVA
jgi:DNA-binding Xre family transcriptional regulator